MSVSKDNREEGSLFDNSSSFKNSSTTLPQVESKASREEKKLIPPDGGWGWLVVFGSFLILALCTFAVFGFSIIFLPLLSSFNTSSTKTAWIFNTHRLVWSVFTIFAGPLTEQFGWRKLTIFGGILNSLSLILSSFASSPDFLFFSYSFLGGIGGTISVAATVIAVSKYFDKHRGFAIGITSLGTCVSSFISPLISNYLIQNYGYVGAARIFGAIVLNQCVGATFLQPLEWHMKPDASEEVFDDAEKDEVFSSNHNEIPPQDDMSIKLQESQRDNKLRGFERQLSVYSACSMDESFHHSIMKTASNKTEEVFKSEKMSKKGFIIIFTNVLKSSYYNLSLMKSYKIIIIASASGCFTLGYINFQLWIPFVVTNSEYSLEIAAWCVSAASVSNIVGRVIISLVSDRKNFNVTYGHMSGVFLMSLSIIAFSFARDITLFLIFVCCWGFGTGIAGSSNANNMIEIMGVDLFPATYAIASLLRGAFSIIFGPIAGIVRDQTSSYTYALCLLGGVTMFGVLLFLFLPLAKRLDRKKDFLEKLRKLEESLK